MTLDEFLATNPTDAALNEFLDQKIQGLNQQIEVWQSEINEAEKDQELDHEVLVKLQRQTAGYIARNNKQIAEYQGLKR